jgi:hypothetical protein
MGFGIDKAVVSLGAMRDLLMPGPICAQHLLVSAFVELGPFVMERIRRKGATTSTTQSAPVSELDTGCRV